MQRSNEDCFYFLTSSCTKGISCSFRHHPSAIACNVICPAWSHGSCNDLFCPLRHSQVQAPQRPSASNGALCYFERSATGCLKSDCAFLHSQPRPNGRHPSISRPATTNLVNRETIKPPVVSVPTTIVEPVPIPPALPEVKIETPPKPESPVPTTKSNGVVPSPAIVPVTGPPAPKIDIPTRSVITQAVNKNHDEPKTNPPSRPAGQRNVVIGNSANTSTRTILHATRPRLVVSSEQKRNDDSDSDLDDLIEQDNAVNNTNTPIAISFPCSTSSITNRLLNSSKQDPATTPSSKDTKPIRLNRDRLPATRTSGSDSTDSVFASSNEKQTSSGTDSLQEDERRTNRLERFKPKPTSPPTRSVVCASNSGNVATISPVERKRPAPQSPMADAQPAKRPSTSSQPEGAQHMRATIGDLCSPPSSSRRTSTRQHQRHSPPPRKSSPRQTRHSPNESETSYPSMNASDWKQEVDRFLAKTTQPKRPLPTSIVLPQPVSHLPLATRFPRPQQMRAPPPPPVRSAPIQRPRPALPPPVIAQSPVKPPSLPTPVSKSIPAPLPPPPPTSSIEDDESRLLEMDEPTDVVDTFAMIDEILLEADHLLDLM